MANLFVHLTPDDLQADLDQEGTGGTGAVTIERLGAATTRLLTDWLARLTGTGGKVILRPVLDLNTTTAVDQHDPPAAMREHVVLRDAHCVFPGCRRDSRACDLDHINPYVPIDDGGPPGQTHPGNLAPLCRTHHRVKTHTAWDYQRHDHGHGRGGYVWTAPPGTSTTSPPATDAHRPPPDRAIRSQPRHPAPTTTNLTAPPPRPQPGRGHRHARDGCPGFETAAAQPPEPTIGGGRAADV